MSTASSSADYTILLDLDGDGTPEEDITSYVMSAMIRRGRTRELSAMDMGLCTLNLNNSDGRFNPDYASGAYFGSLDLYVLISVTATLAMTDYPLFTGYVTRIMPNIMQRTARMECLDLFARLRKFHLNLPLAEDKLTGDRISAILSEFDSATEAAADLDDGQATLPKPYWRNTDALSALQECADHDFGGVIFIAGDGTFVFRDRDARALSSSAGTLTRMQGIEFDRSDDQIFNKVILQLGGFEPGIADSPIWSYQPMPVFLAKGASLVLDPNFAQPAKDVITPVEGTDYVANVSADGTGTDLSSDIASAFTNYGGGAAWTLTNNSPNGVWFQALTIRGTPLLLPTYTRTVTRTAASSIVPFENVYQQSYRLLDEDNLEDLKGWADYISSHYSEPHPRVMLTMYPHSDDSDAQLTQMLARELNDRVTVTDDAFAYSSQIDEDFFIESITHTLDPRAHAHETTWLLTTFTADQFFILDTSELDGSDVLAYV